MVAVREKDAERGGAGEEVLDFEGIEGRVVGGVVFIDHKVDDVRLRGEEEEFEGGVPKRAGGQGPEDVFGERGGLADRMGPRAVEKGKASYQGIA